MHWRTSHSAVLSTESYAFLRSMKHMYNGLQYSRAFSIMTRRENNWSAHQERNYSVAIALSTLARCSWEEAGSVFHPVSERILRTRIKTHLGYASIIAV